MRVSRAADGPVVRRGERTRRTGDDAHDSGTIFDTVRAIIMIRVRVFMILQRPFEFRDDVTSLCPGKGIVLLLSCEKRLFRKNIPPRRSLENVFILTYNLHNLPNFKCIFFLLDAR